jgi:hypothetical protein
MVERRRDYLYFKVPSTQPALEQIPTVFAKKIAK